MQGILSLASCHCCPEDDVGDDTDDNDDINDDDGDDDNSGDAAGIDSNDDDDFRATLKQQANLKSTEVFEQNLYNVLLSPIVKDKVLALDPGYHHGCKIAMLGPTGLA